MKNNQPALIGLCPIGKFAFSHEKAKEHKRSIQARLREMNIRFCDLDGILPDGIVRSYNDIEPAAEYFKSQKIDGLFLVHCNFGTEEATAFIAQKVGVPVLLYGPRDDAPLADGVRLTDTLCGLFAASKVLNKLGVKFSYLENCRVNEPIFGESVRRFAKACRVVSAMKAMRIGQLGGRIDFFWCTIIDEADVLQKFGVQIQPIDMVYFIRDVKERARENYDRYQKELEEYKATLINTDDLPDQGFINGLAARDQLRYLAETLNLDGFAVQGFPSLCEALGDGGELGMSFIQEEYPIGAETDILGVAGSVLLRHACDFETPAFMPEFTVRHPENDNAVLLWHGNAPPSLKKAGSPKMEIFASWIMPTEQRTNIAYPLKDGNLTLCRLDGERGEYRLGVTKAKTVLGPHTLEVYAWAEVENWPKVERNLIEGPYLHHVSCVYADCADVLEEACKFLPNLTYQDLAK